MKIKLEGYSMRENRKSMILNTFSVNIQYKVIYVVFWN